MTMNRPSPVPVHMAVAVEHVNALRDRQATPLYDETWTALYGPPMIPDAPRRRVHQADTIIALVLLSMTLVICAMALVVWFA